MLFCNIGEHPFGVLKHTESRKPLFIGKPESNGHVALHKRVFKGAKLGYGKAVKGVEEKKLILKIVLGL